MKNITIFTGGSLQKFKNENNNLPLEKADFCDDLKTELGRLLVTIYAESTAVMEEDQFLDAIRELGISVTAIWETPRGARRNEVYE
jgi:hypothetical protein